MIELERTRLMLENLGLAQAALTLDSHLDYAARSEITYLEFINRLLEDEVDFRRKRSEETRLKLSRLPQKKTLDDFDFSFQPSIDERQIRELATLSFIHRQENVILLGPPGVGKSHIAISLAVEAIRQGLSVYFVSMEKLLYDLRRANNEGKLHNRWKVYQRPGMLVIDEIGYSQLDRVSGNLFFQLVCSRYEKGSMILTSNKGFGEWGDLMGDVPLATAILDRLLHHAHVVNIRGQSYRMKSRIKAQQTWWSIPDRLRMVIFRPALMIKIRPALTSGYTVGVAHLYSAWTMLANVDEKEWTYKQADDFHELWNIAALYPDLFTENLDEIIEILKQIKVDNDFNDSNALLKLSEFNTAIRYDAK